MGATYSRSYSPGFVFGARPARNYTEDIRDWVHALNESMQRQLEEADKRHMEMNQQHKRDKE